MIERGLVSGHPTKDVHPELVEGPALSVVEGSVSYSSPPLLGRKHSSVKSRVSISSKLIVIKGLQLHYFGHLRKTGGRGSYRVVHRRLLPAIDSSASPARHAPAHRSFSGGGPLLPTPLFPLHTRIPLVSPFFPLLMQKQGVYLAENVGAPTFLIFPLIFRTFLALSALRRVTSASHRRSRIPRRQSGKRAGIKASATLGSAERRKKKSEPTLSRKAEGQRLGYLEAVVANCSAAAESLRWTE